MASDKRERRIFQPGGITLELLEQAVSGNAESLCNERGEVVGPAAPLLEGLPGRALDAWLARRVLGWKAQEVETLVGGVWGGSYDVEVTRPTRGRIACPELSVTDAGLGRLLDEVKYCKGEEALEGLCLWYENKTWRARWWEGGPYVSAFTRAHAVAKAALVRALGLHTCLPQAEEEGGSQKPKRPKRHRLPTLPQEPEAPPEGEPQA